MRVHYVAMLKHNGKSRNKTLKYAHAIVRENKMADSSASSFAANSVALQRDYFTKKKHFNSIICSAEAICRSSWRTGHTNTPNYHNLAAHARRGLIMYNTYTRTAHHTQN